MLWNDPSIISQLTKCIAVLCANTRYVQLEIHCSTEQTEGCCLENSVFFEINN